MFVGYLCATQIDGRIETGDQPISLASPKLVAVYHGGFNSRTKRPYGTVRLILYDTQSKRTWPEDLDPQHVVMVESPD